MMSFGSDRRRLVSRTADILRPEVLFEILGPRTGRSV